MHHAMLRRPPPGLKPGVWLGQQRCMSRHLLTHYPASRLPWRHVIIAPWPPTVTCPPTITCLPPAVNIARSSSRPGAARAPPTLSFTSRTPSTWRAAASGRAASAQTGALPGLQGRGGGQGVGGAWGEDAGREHGQLLYALSSSKHSGCKWYAGICLRNRPQGRGRCPLLGESAATPRPALHASSLSPRRAPGAFCAAGGSAAGG